MIKLRLSRIVQNLSLSASHFFAPNPKLLTTAALSIATLLSGCSMGIYEGGFECDPGRGMGCLSISEVNERVDEEPRFWSQKTGQVRKVPDSVTPDSRIWYAPEVFSAEKKPCPSGSCPSSPDFMNKREAYGSF